MNKDEIIEDKKTGKRYGVYGETADGKGWIIRELQEKCRLQEWVEKEFSYAVHQDSAKCGFFKAIEVLEKENAKYSPWYPPTASQAIGFLKDYAGIEEK